jgi:hypothetical protein
VNNISNSAQLLEVLEENIKADIENIFTLLKRQEAKIDFVIRSLERMGVGSIPQEFL